MHTENMIAMCKSNLRDATVSIPGGIKNLVTASETAQGQNEISRTEKRLGFMLQGLVNKTAGKRFRSADFKKSLFYNIEDVI